MAKQFEAYDPGNRKISRRWMVLENDGSEDGRIVADKMEEEDAVLVAKLLNLNWEHWDQLG